MKIVYLKKKQGYKNSKSPKRKNTPKINKKN